MKNPIKKNKEISTIKQPNESKEISNTKQSSKDEEKAQEINTTAKTETPKEAKGINKANEFKKALNKPLSKKSVALILGAAAFSLIILTVGMYIGVDKINSDAAAANKRIIKEKVSGAQEVDLADSLRTSTVSYVMTEEAMPAYSNAQIRNLDVSKPSGATVSDLKLVTKGNLVGLESAFVKAEQNYGVNCLFVMAIASLESANGTMCFRPNNMFGFGNSGYSSKAECIDVVSKALANNYLSSSGSLYCGKTISDVNKRYASSSTWDDKVATNMTRYYSVISKHHNAALEKLK